jgi:hypothetical protein
VRKINNSVVSKIPSLWYPWIPLSWDSTSKIFGKKLQLHSIDVVLFLFTVPTTT